jgi:predicted amino acid dehydrogenase
MRFATLGHLMFKENIEQIPKKWIQDNWICSPEFDLKKTKGRITGLTLTAKEILSKPLDEIREEILKLATYLYDELNIEIIQLGALTTSVTSGGKWLTKSSELKAFVNHGDSYTSSVTCQAVKKSLNLFGKDSKNLTLAIVGAYGIIGEAVSKILVSSFKDTILIGRRQEKLFELEKKIKGNFSVTTNLETKNSDVIVTATNHPEALLKSEHLKKGAIIIDVSQPSNVSYNLCQERKDIKRVDGGFVDLPKDFDFQLPVIPKGKIFCCVAEAIMQALEEERNNHVGAIDLDYLKKTEKWADKYGFILSVLTNYGERLTK